jgi:hypothetical protein
MNAFGGAMSRKTTDSSNTQDDGSPGTTARFPYDRMTVEHFRKNFPRARWSDVRKAWFVPGKTAARRFNRWLEREFAGADAYADMRGRDAYAFDPLVSKYLLAHGDRLQVRTPYSRTVVEEMRQVPFAFWDGDLRVWTVPYRSYEELRRRWSRIEAAAVRNEPEARKERQAERRGSLEEKTFRARAAERRRRRYPLQPENLPPFGRALMTRQYGIVVFLGSDGESVDLDVLHSYYPELPAYGDYVWGHWRPATFEELVKTWPSRSSSMAETEGQIWWQPTLGELRAARKSARSAERRRKDK